MTYWWPCFKLGQESIESYSCSAKTSKTSRIPQNVEKCVRYNQRKIMSDNVRNVILEDSADCLGSIK